MAATQEPQVRMEALPAPQVLRAPWQVPRPCGECPHGGLQGSSVAHALMVE